MLIHNRFPPYFPIFIVCSTLLTTVTFLFNSAPGIPFAQRVSEIEYRPAPGGYVKYTDPIPSNYSYCNFNFGLPQSFEYGENDLSFSPELGINSPYRVIYNIIEANLGKDVPRVTYATHISANFISFITEQIRFWDGPVSVAAFVPEDDIYLVLDQIVKYCFCLPDMSRVSLHLVINKNYRQKTKDFSFRKHTDCIVEDSSQFKTYRNAAKYITYPVNVCRNVARSGALTDYVMVCDTELMPSKGLGERFLDMMKTYKCKNVGCSKTIFVVPIFEIESTQAIPREKKELRDLLVQEKAVYFHRLICTHCQKFPRMEEWLKRDPGNTIKPFIETRREAPYDRWEPIYIGTKNEPMYNEVLSWEGLQDKMLQMLEMCLMKYRLVILDGAFLVHWPGIKKVKTKVAETWRKPFQKENARQYKSLVRNLSRRYPPNARCKLK